MKEQTDGRTLRPITRASSRPHHPAATADQRFIQRLHHTSGLQYVQYVELALENVMMASSNVSLGASCMPKRTHILAVYT